MGLCLGQVSRTCVLLPLECPAFCRPLGGGPGVSTGLPTCLAVGHGTEWYSEVPGVAMPSLIWFSSGVHCIETSCVKGKRQIHFLEGQHGKREALFIWVRALGGQCPDLSMAGAIAL